MLCVSSSEGQAYLQHFGNAQLLVLQPAQCGIPGCTRRYVVVNAETGAVQVLCEIGRDTPPALLTLPSGDVLLSKDNTSRFLGALPYGSSHHQCGMYSDPVCML